MNNPRYISEVELFTEYADLVEAIGLFEAEVRSYVKLAHKLTVIRELIFKSNRVVIFREAETWKACRTKNSVVST
jgi:hypothetical protein